MQLPEGRFNDYVTDVAELLERYGVALDLGTELVVEESPDRSLSFQLRGTLPDGRNPARSVLEIRERWRPLDRVSYERSDYAYELLDHDRGFRRGFHLHDRELFVRRFTVVVHEHCERPIGAVGCAHYFGTPIKSAFAGAMALIEAWTDEAPDCSARRCLE